VTHLQSLLLRLAVAALLIHPFAAAQKAWSIPFLDPGTLPTPGLTFSVETDGLSLSWSTDGLRLLQLENGDTGIDAPGFVFYEQMGLPRLPISSVLVVIPQARSLPWL
jgi:hypothetical protein